MCSVDPDPLVERHREVDESDLKVLDAPDTTDDPALATMAHVSEEVRQVMER